MRTTRGAEKPIGTARATPAVGRDVRLSGTQSSTVGQSVQGKGYAALGWQAACRFAYDRGSVDSPTTAAKSL